MEQRLIPIHLCPQCGSRYVYTFLDEECPDCKYKFEKEESMSMIAHCPICLGEELAVRVKPYWGETFGDSLSEGFDKIVKKSTQDSYTEVVVKHVMYKPLYNQFESIARTSIFELWCEQCGKNLCREGTSLVLLMKDVENHDSEEKKEEKEKQEPSSETRDVNKSSCNGCLGLIMLCLITIISSVVKNIFIG